MVESNQQTGIEPKPPVKKITRRQFLKRAVVGAGTVGLAAEGLGETRKDYSQEGFDPEIQASLEREGIAGVHLRMYLGNHYFTQETMKKMELQGATVVTGELNFTPATGPIGGNETKSVSEEFFNNLKKLPNGVTGSGQMQLQSQRSADLLENFSNNKAILASDNGIGGADVQKAADEVMVGWGLFGSLLYFAGLAWKTGALKEWKNPISRRSFLKGASIGAGAAVTGAVAQALYQTAENRGWIEPPANTEVSYIYSKLFNDVPVDISTKVLEVAGDKRLLQAFQSLVSVRNKVMSLNNWYLTESLARSRGLRTALTGKNKFVEMGFFAGNGHAGVKEEFCKGPAQIETELKSEVGSWLDQYEHEMAIAPEDKKEQILNYYKGLMGAFGRPYLIIQSEINQEGTGLDNYMPKVNTPEAIMYRTLTEKIKQGKTNNQNISNLEQLVSGLVRDQHFPDGTYINVSGQNVLSEGKYHGVLSAKNPAALKERFEETNFISPDDLQSVDGEIYPDLYSYEYVGPVEGRKVSVGIAIVRGIPMTFFQKEDISFIRNSSSFPHLKSTVSS